MPKYRAGFVIAAYKGFKVDWVALITEFLKDAIESLAEGKKSWMGIAQWLTLLVPPVLTIKQKKRGQPETMPKKATKRRQLLEMHTPGWTPEDASQPEEGQSSPKPELAEKGKEKPAKKASREKNGEKGSGGTETD